jgi:hypothetical protein
LNLHVEQSCYVELTTVKVESNLATKMHYQSKTTKKNFLLDEFHSNQSKTTNSMTATKVKQPKELGFACLVVSIPNTKVAR